MDFAGEDYDRVIDVSEGFYFSTFKGEALKEELEG